jgi:hypothetical protein
LLGICLGHQIVGRAAGADTRRLRFGHHGANHPVRDLDTGAVQVTAQNHEVQVVGDSLPSRAGLYVSQLNLNDRSVEGLRHRELPIEWSSTTPSAPGPLDALAVFDRFVAACDDDAGRHPARRRVASPGDRRLHCCRGTGLAAAASLSNDLDALIPPCRAPTRHRSIPVCRRRVHRPSRPPSSGSTGPVAAGNLTSVV